MNSRRFLIIFCALCAGILIQLLVFHRSVLTIGLKAAVASESTQLSDSKIPKILHQTFSESLVFNDYRKNIEGCLKLNPDWQYFFWRDEDIVAFINDHYPYFMRKYLIFKMHLQRGDCIRYMVLHHYGGIYIDMDVECVKPFFPSLSNLTAFVDQEPKEHAVILHGKDFSAMNSAMGSVKGHPFFLRLILAMMQVDDNQGGAGETTGSHLLTAQLIEWYRGNATRSYTVTLLDPPVFSPHIDFHAHNFKDLCRQINLAIFVNPSDPAAQRTQLMREAMCINYAKRNWTHDLTSSQTVGRHLFTHLGFRWSTITNLFDITDVKADVLFYKKDKHIMCGH